MTTVTRSETALRVEAMRALIEALGAVNAERFIAHIKSDKFDYTEWQRGLWKDKSLEDIHQAAADAYTRRHGDGG